MAKLFSTLVGGSTGLQTLPGVSSYLSSTRLGKAVDNSAVGNVFDGLTGAAIGGVSNFLDPRFKPSESATKMPDFKPGMGSEGLEIPGGVSPFQPGNQQAFIPEAYQAKDVSGALPEYEMLRSNLSNQFNAQRGSAMDALDRRFAALGNLNSGARLKSQEKLESSLAQARNEALNQIGFQEAQARRGLQEAEAGRAFASGESRAQMGFGASQSAIDRANQIGMFNTQLEQQNRQFQFDAKSKLRQLDLALYQAQVDNVNTQFNKELAQYQAYNQGGLLGGGGLLGTGLHLFG